MNLVSHYNCINVKHLMGKTPSRSPYQLTTVSTSPPLSLEASKASPSDSSKTVPHKGHQRPWWCYGDQSRCPPHLQYSKRHVTQLVTPCPSKHFLTRCLSRSVSSPSGPWAGDNGGPQVPSSLLSSTHALWTNTNSCGLKYHISGKCLCTTQTSS